jgi:hypothetical protein
VAVWGILLCLPMRNQPLRTESTGTKEGASTRKPAPQQRLEANAFVLRKEIRDEEIFVYIGRIYIGFVICFGKLGFRF